MVYIFTTLCVFLVQQVLHIIFVSGQSHQTGHGVNHIQQHGSISVFADSAWLCSSVHDSLANEIIQCHVG